jgi:RING-box protein 1
MSKQTKEFELIAWYPILLIKENIDNDTCNLCRNSIFDKCISCSSIIPYEPNGKCEISYNKKCTHSYHAHCIDNWMKTNKNCPVDMEQWQSCNKSLSNTLKKQAKKQ